MIVYSRQWWLTLIVVGIVSSCTDSTSPNSSMLKVDGYVEPWVSKVYSNGGGICDPVHDNDSPNQIPEINLCFIQFSKALGISGATIGLCASHASGAGTAAAVIGRWGGCLAGTVASLESWKNWLDATQVDGYMDWSEREIRDRMREAIFARMYAERNKPEAQ